MQPLIDCDVLIYECGFASEAGWGKDKGAPPFDYCAEFLDMRIQAICNAVEATAPPILFLTGKTNFRNTIAKRTKYKDRPSNKPYHYKNLIAYVKGKYDWRMKEGIEADDFMAIEQNNNPNAIICTRDKDLFNFPGHKFSWELGNQPSRGPILVDDLGELKLSPNNKKLIGHGGLFFYAQCLMGDKVDSIPGCPGIGIKKAFDILNGCDCLTSAYFRVLSVYRHYYEDLAETELLEQARLLHMTRRMDGNRILLWNPPNTQYEEWYDLDTGTIERTSELQSGNGSIHMGSELGGEEIGESSRMYAFEQSSATDDRLQTVSST